MAYRVYNVDLTNARTQPTEIVSRDKTITEVTIAKFSGELSLAFGADRDMIDVDAPISFKPTGEDGRGGLYIQNAAQSGVTVQIIVATKDGLDVDVRV